MAEVAVATIAAVELTVETANWIKRNLPSQKIKEGFALLYNGMLLLYTEFDNLPLDIKTDLLKIYDAKSEFYEEWDPKKQRFISSLKKARKFYQDCKKFKKRAEVSSNNARAKKAHQALEEGRRLHPTSTDSIAEVLAILPNILEKVQSSEHMDILETLRGGLHSKAVREGSVSGDQDSSTAAGNTQTESAELMIDLTLRSLDLDAPLEIDDATSDLSDGESVRTFRTAYTSRSFQ
ncbi:hypothetical protein B0H14DRAFT_3016043 [Mycena olivaceomarginata]|nr:hypothetical protein B0H14DRAFT_3016043 [Mycena olivaceomarginata]